MSWEYDSYLYMHKQNVANAFYWMNTNIPHVTENVSSNFENDILKKHDESKSMIDEYASYDIYFYGNNKSSKVVSDFNTAWLHHIHRNPHHWQYWVLLEDDNDGNFYKTIEIPYDYIIEMICDWWSFSFKENKLYEIFDWYEKHKEIIKMHPKSRATVEYILREIRNKLDELGTDN